MGLINYFRWFFSPSTTNEIYLYDDDLNEKSRLVDILLDMENRIRSLEEENIETTNVLYEIVNRLDKLDNPDYNLKKFSLGDS